MTTTDAWAALAAADRAGSYDCVLTAADERLSTFESGDQSEEFLGWMHARIQAMHLVRQHAEAMPTVQRMIDAAPTPPWLALGLAWRAFMGYFVSLDRSRPSPQSDSLLDDLSKASALLAPASTARADDRVVAAAHVAVGNGYWLLRLFELAEPQYEAAVSIAVRVEPTTAVRALLSHAMMLVEWADEHRQMDDRAGAVTLYESAARLANRARDTAPPHDLGKLRLRAHLFEVAAVARFGPPAPVIEALTELATLPWEPTAHLAVLQVAMSHAHRRAGDRDAALSWARSAVAIMRDRAGGPASIQAHEALAAALPVSENSADLLSYALAIARNRWRDRQQLLNAARVSLDYERVARQVSIVDRLAKSDPLTGLGNRRALEQAIESWLSDPFGPRTGTLLLADIDGLKLINDRFGHASGDQAIKTIAAHLREQCGPAGIVVRWGGDEFVVVLPDATYTDAQVLIRGLTADVGGHSDIPMSLSVGCAAGPLSEMGAMMASADADMYRRRTTRRRRLAPRPGREDVAAGE